MEIIRDPTLFRAIREEVSQAEAINDSTGDPLSLQQLASLPLLQSVYTEVLRVHVSILITRTSIEPVTVGGYDLPTGSIFQAPTHVAHFDEATCMYLFFYPFNTISIAAWVVPLLEGILTTDPYRGYDTSSSLRFLGLPSR